MTKTEKIEKLLLDKGLVEVESTSRKYRKFYNKECEYFYWLGKRGALRRGKTVSKSFSIKVD